MSENLKKRVLKLLDEAYELRISDLSKSISLANQALSLSKEDGNQTLVAKSLSTLSLFYMILSDYDKSMEFSEKAISIFQNLGDEMGIAHAKYNIAGIYYKTDNLHSGLMYLIDCLEIYQKYNDHHNQARVLKSLGTIYEYFGDEKRAVETYLDTIQAAKKAKDKNLESNALNPLSGIYLNRGQIKRAMLLISESIKMKKETGDIRGLAFALYGRAKIYTKTEEFEKAEADFFEAIKIHTDAGEKLGLGMAYHKLGYLYMCSGQNKKAKENLIRAVNYGEEYSIALIKFKCDYLLYELYKKEGNSEKALSYLEAYLVEKESVINSQTLKVIESYEIITKMDRIEAEAKMQKEKADIIKKKNVAEQTAKVKQDFLSTMSHEIRTPLNAVITISSLLSKRKNNEDQQLLDSLNFSAHNLLYIINDILDFTKLDSGKVELDFRPVDFKKLLKNICNTYEGLATEKGLDCTLEITDKVHEGYQLDEVKLSQILGNLISNAIKFTNNGAVTLKVSIPQKNKTKDTVRFEVIDTGEGISDEFLETIFESFSQPKMIKTRKEGGSGLGLAIVKKLIELFRSDIKVETKFGKGSTFYFDLELIKCKAPEFSLDIDGYKLQGKTVLLAEDNKVNALVLGRLLERWGLNFDLAQNGLEAVNMAREKKFDFILMDIHMPEVDGFEATRLIRRNKNGNHLTPIFALTADITAKQQKEFYQFFNGFLLKPIEKEKLYEALVNNSDYGSPI